MLISPHKENMFGSTDIAMLSLRIIFLPEPTVSLKQENTGSKRRKKELQVNQQKVAEQSPGLCQVTD